MILKRAVAGQKMAHLPKITSTELAEVSRDVPGLRLRMVQNPMCFCSPAPFSSSLTALCRMMKKHSVARAHGRLVWSTLITTVVSIVPLDSIAQEQNIPVTIGGSIRLAACPERALVERSPHIDLMPVPDRTARPRTRLVPGTQLFVCERQGEWLGVVVTNVEPEKCGVSVSIERREPYRGGCTSGWILRNDAVIKIHAVPR